MCYELKQGRVGLCCMARKSLIRHAKNMLSYRVAGQLKRSRSVSRAIHTLRNSMTIALKSLSWLCFAWCIYYVTFSCRTALWIGRRHNGRRFLLEFQPQRARGSKEATRAKLLRRIGLGAAVALPLGLCTLVVSLIWNL
jgi:hypothetical protein